MNRPSFWHELKERKLVQWGLGFLAGAWVTLEFADFLSDTFTWPAVVLRVLTVVLAFAFLAVLVVAWYHGEKGHQRMRPTELLLLVLLASAAAVVSWRIATPVAAAEDDPTAAIDSSTSPAAPLLLQGSADGRTSIAVLPFTSVSADPSNDYFSDGVMEDILVRLSRVPGLRVISRTSVMQYRNTAKTIPQIAEELGVEYVLEGTVQRHDDRVRITAQLIDARRDGHVWADSYDREVRDILAVQSEVAEVIAGQLSAELTPGTLAELRDTAQVDPEAYNLYLQGRQIARSEEPGEAAKGVELLGSAIAKDSNMVGAYTALAEALVPASIGLGEASLPPEPPAIEGALNRALAAHPRAEIHTFVARRAIEDWDFEKAEAAAQRAVEANPNYARGQHWYGLLLARTGRQSEGLERLRAALSIDPRSPQINADLGELLYAMGRFDEAIAQLRKTLALDSTSASAYLNLGLAYSAKGQHDEAIAALRRAARLEPGNPVVQGYLGYVLADAGQTEEANRILSDMERRRRPPASAIAQILAGLGQSEQALQWLEKAAGERSSILLSPRVVRSFEELRDDPRFQRIMKIAATGSAVPSPPTRGPLPDSVIRRRRGDGG